jgi:hypothetical protein
MCFRIAPLSKDIKALGKDFSLPFEMTGAFPLSLQS